MVHAPPTRSRMMFLNTSLSLSAWCVPTTPRWSAAANVSSRSCGIRRCSGHACDLAGDDCHGNWRSLFLLNRVKVFADLRDGRDVGEHLADCLNRSAYNWQIGFGFRSRYRSGIRRYGRRWRNFCWCRGWLWRWFWRWFICHLGTWLLRWCWGWFWCGFWGWLWSWLRLYRRLWRRGRSHARAW